MTEHTDRWVDPAIRDSELEPVLDAALASPTLETLAASLRFGATIDIDDEDVDRQELALSCAASSRPARGSRRSCDSESVI